MTNMFAANFTTKKKAVPWANRQNELRHIRSFPLRFLTLPFLFLSPPKNFPIWSRRPGFFFLRPSPKAACAELLADAMAVVAVGRIFVKCGIIFFLFVSLLNERERKKTEEEKEKRDEREEKKKKASLI